MTRPEFPGITPQLTGPDTGAAVEFWGDRYAVVADPAGHHWSFGTQREDLTVEEVQARAVDAWPEG